MSRTVSSARLIGYACVFLLGMVSSLAAQDHTNYEAADIEYGLSVYQERCLICHGDNGDAIAGVNFRTGQLRRAASDRELRQIITAGIAGTGMLAFDLDTAEMTGIVAYLRNMNYEIDAGNLGDADRGRTVFESQGACLQCHRVQGKGPRSAPDLTAIGAIRPMSALRRALVDPTGTMQPINRPVEVVMADGTSIRGRRLNEDTYTIQLIDENERLRSIDKNDLVQFNVLTESPMPSYEDRLSPEELADLLAYLVSLKG